MYGLATHFQLLLGETMEVSNKICNISWTSDDARNRVNELIRKWNRINFGCMAPAAGINTCKSYLNEMLRALEKEVNANQGWAIGQGILSLANSFGDSTFNKVASAITGVACEYCSDKANSVQALMNEIQRILNTY